MKLKSKVEKKRESTKLSLFKRIAFKFKMLMVSILIADYRYKAKDVNPLVSYPFNIFFELDAKEYDKTHTLDEFIEYVESYPERLKQQAKVKEEKEARWKTMDDILIKGHYYPKDSEDCFEAYLLLLDSGFTHQEIVEYHTENIHFFIG